MRIVGALVLTASLLGGCGAPAASDPTELASGGGPMPPRATLTAESTGQTWSGWGSIHYAVPIDGEACSRRVSTGFTDDTGHVARIGLSIPDGATWSVPEGVRNDVVTQQAFLEMGRFTWPSGAYESPGDGAFWVEDDGVEVRIGVSAQTRCGGAQDEQTLLWPCAEEPLDEVYRITFDDPTRRTDMDCEELAGAVRSWAADGACGTAGDLPYCLGDEPPVLNQD